MYRYARCGLAIADYATIFLFQLPPKQIEVATEESVNLKGILVLPIHEVDTSLAILNFKIF